MPTPTESYWLKLVKKEGWEIVEHKKEHPLDTIDPYVVVADNQEFKLTHPLSIHLKLYTRKKNPVDKYAHLKAAHDYLWPDYIETWNAWEERIFLAHCQGFRYISLAGGSGLGKSLSAAKIGFLWFLGDPTGNACLIASTTLESLETRIWGYAVKLLDKMNVQLPVRLVRSKPQKIIYVGNSGLDLIHRMVATAIRSGDDERTLSTIIGRHPDRGMMVILDEATDLPPALSKAFINLEQGVDFFQLWAIGNSASKNDLHGSLSTPKLGWDSIDPMRDDAWETTQKKGVCLYFNPYKSPAIMEKDEKKRTRLSKFLIDEIGLDDKINTYGETSDAFFRFVLGFWKNDVLDGTIVTEQFLKESDVYKTAEWAGLYPLEVVGGLDPAIQMGGNNCVLRFAIFGQTSDGRLVLDFRGTELINYIETSPSKEKSTELQLAENIVFKMREYGCPMQNLAIDATGLGRTLGELIRLVAGVEYSPMKFISTGGRLYSAHARGTIKDDPYTHVVNPSQLWFKFREFIQHKQLLGLDDKTAFQLVNRLVHLKHGKHYIETKRDFKNRMAVINPKAGNSPDEADAAILALHAAIVRFGFYVGQRKEVKEGVERNSLWLEKAFIIEKEMKIFDVKKESSRHAHPLCNFSGSLEDLPVSSRSARWRQ